MTRTSQHVAILVTAPDRRTARRVARRALELRLAACVQLLAGLESHYRWKGRMERSAEVLMIFKTRRRCAARLEAMILEEHPYDTAQVVALPITAASGKYLRWLDAELGKKP